MAADERRVVDAVRAMCETVCRDEGIEPPLPPDALARLYIAIFQGVARQRAVDPEEVPEDLFARLIRFIEDALKALGSPRDRSSRSGMAGIPACPCSREPA